MDNPIVGLKYITSNQSKILTNSHVIIPYSLVKTARPMTMLFNNSYRGYVQNSQSRMSSNE